MGSIYRILGAAALVTITILPGSSSTSMSDEKRLTKHLLENYERVGLHGRPVVNGSTAIDVAIRFSLVKIFDVEVHEQQMITLGRLFLTWTDVLLRWMPEDFGNIKVLALPLDRIWMPDIKLFNAASPPVPLYNNLLVQVKHNGDMTYVPSFKFTSLCAVPKGSEDNPECSLIFGSWVHSTNRLRLSASSGPTEADVSVQNPEYELYAMDSEENSRSYSCCEGVLYGDVTYTLRLGRHRRRARSTSASAASEAVSVLIPLLVATLSLLAATP